MKKFLSLLSRKTKLKCMCVIALAMVNAILSSIWPVRLSDLYTSISSGNVLSLKQGLVLIVQFGILRYFGRNLILWTIPHYRPK